MWNKPKMIETQKEADNIFKGTTGKDVLVIHRYVNMEKSFHPRYVIAVRTSIFVLFFDVPADFLPYKMEEMYDLNSWNFDSSRAVPRYEIEKLAKQISTVGGTDSPNI